MTKEIRIASIGVGTLGFLHASNIQHRVPNARIEKVAATREESAKRAADKLGIQNWTTSLSEVFEDDNVDAVVITTPNYTHADLIKRAAESGKHIFVEKPITKTIEEAHEVIEIINRNNVICQVGFMRRFDPTYQEAKRRIEQGDIGQPIYFKAVGRDPGSPPESYVKTSGSIFHDFTIHDFDAARFLMDSEIKSIRSVGKVLMDEYLKKYNDYDQAHSLVTFESGAFGDIESSRNAGYGYDIRSEVIGTEGTIQLGSLRNQDVQFLSLNGNNSSEIVPEYQTRFRESFVKEMEYFVGVLNNENEPVNTAVSALKSLEVAVSAVESCENDQEIEVRRKVFEAMK
ncbi:Gfo/Idh/MocA family oxidoreductase [Virgibacillus sp. SK37]|uniref:Gfo/Idh/MocA family oxidoreductase n=1 Tax=Virgibacillus sp. SK37 TaxID=403957 RepID=UPI0011A1D3A3|nr:Gfo/Idh/MocA family oxidoreductase [Virgibacillus sp. SK37]